MRISAFILGTLFICGCSSEANKKLDEFADRACACKDAECAKKVEEDFTKWLSSNTDAKGDEDKAKKSAARMATCIAKARMGKAMEGAEKAMEKAKEAVDKAADTAKEATE
jgi:phage shock protein A